MLLLLWKRSSLTCSLPVASMTLQANPPQALTTEKHYCALSLKTLAITPLAPSATTTNKNFCALLLKTLSISVLTPSAATTNKNFSALPLKTLSLSALTLSAVTTNKNFSAIPLATLTLTARVPNETTTINHKSATPLTALTITKNAPGATTTNRNYSATAVAALAVTPRAPNSTVTTNHKVALPSVTLSLTALTPGATTTTGAGASHTSTLPSLSLALSSRILIAVNTSPPLPLGEPPSTGGADASSGRYGKHLGHLYIVPPELEPVVCTLPTLQLKLESKKLEAVATAHARAKLPALFIESKPSLIRAVIGFDEARLQEELEIIQLALDDELMRNRGYTPANVLGYYEQQQLEADLEAIFLAIDQR